MNISKSSDHSVSSSTLAVSSTLEKPINIRSISIFTLTVLACIFFLQWAQELLIPLVLSILISYALDPIVSYFEKWRIPRFIGAGILLVGLVSGFGYLTYELRDEAASFVEQLPVAAQKLTRTLRDYRGNSEATMKKVEKAATELEKAATQLTGTGTTPGVTKVQIEQPAAVKIREYVWSGSKGLLSFFGSAILSLFLIYYLLISGDLFKRKLVKLAGPSLSNKKVTVQILDEINRQIQRFLLVQLFAGIIVGLATWLAFTFIGLEQAAMWGVVAGVLNSVPYLGPVVVTGGTALVGFMQFGTIPMAIMVAGISLAITSLEGYLLTPWLTSRAGKMNAAAVFIGLLFWGWIWGVWGLLLGIPILMVIKAICDRIDDFKPVSELLSQ